MNDASGSRAPADQAVWTRVEGVQGAPLDLMAARLGRTHFAPHTHDEYAIGACVAGLEVIRYRGELHYSGPGSIVAIEPGEPHTGGPAIADGMAYRVMYPGSSLLADATAVVPHFREPVIEDPGLAEALRLAHVALSRGDDPLEGEARLLSVLAELVRRHAAPVPLGDGGPDDSGWVARTVMERLADQITGPPSLAEIAAELGMSRFRLLRSFRETAGMPPYAWLAQHRVNRARALLESGHRPAEAAALTGFADQAHLTRWFRRVLGVTPGAFRNSVQDSERRVG
ncbi:helix-turn-helix transcriptional regulator [Thermomonospora umbrina]|uniref:AraC family transcriptional regulator n=1 Tax=Thermomonospora umbrina TaxID=111806 RepID=A0A3D9SN62_9ACTN|nr:AraC family transcriptional regulator [Thermomonospora umbrina]REE97298.1 AraC family transcriptional regulator [Thermomonospora umbrina]